MDTVLYTFLVESNASQINWFEYFGRDDSYLFPCAFVQLEVNTPLDALSKKKKEKKPLDGMRFFTKVLLTYQPKTNMGNQC